MITVTAASVAASRGILSMISVVEYLESMNTCMSPTERPSTDAEYRPSLVASKATAHELCSCPRAWNRPPLDAMIMAGMIPQKG